jgi:hypothetical protein
MRRRFYTTAWLSAVLCAATAVAAFGATALPVTGLHDYAYTEPFRYWSFDIRYISDRLVEYIGTNAEVIAARGSRGTLDERMDESLNEDGTLKETAASSLMGQWVLEVAVPAYVSDLEFALTGDVTSIYVEGRRVLMHGGGGYVYATVDSSAYASPTTTVTVAGGTVPATIDYVRYSLIAESRALPEYTTAFKGTSAEFSGAVTSASATIGSAVLGAAKLTAGAGTDYVMRCLDSAGTMEWGAPGAIELVPDQVWSEHIADADGTSGQITTSGKGVKTPHLQDSAVTLVKCGADLKTTAGTAYSLFPRGGIIMWSGTLGGTGNKYPMVGGSANTSWHICDGTDGTPDLRDRFIVGSGSTYSIGAGPSTATTHAHGAGTALHGPSHTHTGPSHTHTGPSHMHYYTTEYAGLIGDGLAAVNLGSNIGVDSLGYLRVRDGAASGTANVKQQINGHTDAGGTGATGSGGTGATASGGTGDVTGTTATASSLPPYFALAYIIKL